jgi:hypothetical protein
MVSDFMHNNFVSAEEQSHFSCKRIKTFASVILMKKRSEITMGILRLRELTRNCAYPSIPEIFPHEAQE